MVLIRLAATNALTSVECTPDMRVADLKQAIYEAHAYPMKKQKLSVNGKAMKDKKKIEDMVDPSKDIIDVSISTRGGCFGCEFDCCCCDFMCCF
jgi:hypothetical protein